MKFKDQPSVKQFQNACPMLKVLAWQFEKISLTFGIDPVVTRVISKIQGDSGVHSMGFGIDFRNQHNDTFLYNLDQQVEILKYINELFPRSDGKKTLIHHSFNGGLYHWHAQVPPDINTLKGMIYPTYAVDDDLLPVA